MKRILSAIIFFCFVAIIAGPCPAQTRARRTGQNPAPDGTDQSSTPGQPPVLRGNTNDGTTSTQSGDPRNTRTGPEEVSAGDVIRVNTTLVSIPVSVMDRDGKYIPNLRKQDFRIYEDGVEQEVAYFGTVEKPFTVALMIDTSGSTTFKLDQIQNAAIAFVDQLRPDDRVMIVSFDDRIRVLAEPTNDRELLRQAIMRTHTGGGTRLYDAVDQVMNDKLKHVEGRKAIVLFTDGVDTTSRSATYESNVSDAEEQEALIYPVEFDTYGDLNSRSGGGRGIHWPGQGGRGGIIFNWPFPIPGTGGGGGYPGGGGRGGGYPGGGRGGGGGGSSREDYERASEYLHDLADKTGARLYEANSEPDLSQAFAQVAAELRRQYTLGYYTKKPAQPGERRGIKVRVNRTDLVVRARDTYVFKGQGQNTTAQGQTQSNGQPVLRRQPLAESNPWDRVTAH